MRIEIVVACVSGALNVVLWGALYHKLHRLPPSLWKAAAPRDRAADEKRALDVLQEAAASRIGGLVIGIRTYHEQLGGIVQAQLAEAEVRARISERRASEAGVALCAASALVRDLRAFADDLPSLFERRAMQMGIAVGKAAANEDERSTLLGEERESGDQDLTIVQDHPLPRTGPVPPSTRPLASADRQDGAS